MDRERHNHRQIELLNQRGGRTLSIVDLIRAGTISVPMAAVAMRAMHRGASLLTGARPGGAGKTTLMAALLGFLPPGEEIVTVEGPGVIARGLGEAWEEQACYLVHEIGNGHWYGYLWGPQVGRFFSLLESGQRIASCLHADTLEEMGAIVTAPRLGVSGELFSRVGLILFMHVSHTPQGYRRRVCALYAADASGRRRRLFSWDPATDTFPQSSDLPDPEGLKPYAGFLETLVESGETDTRAVRRRVVEFYLKT